MWVQVSTSTSELCVQHLLTSLEDMNSGIWYKQSERGGCGNPASPSTYNGAFSVPLQSSRIYECVH